MSRPRLLDLYCGAGVGADGYIAAGFDVLGVDVEPQPHYPGTFVQADASTVLAQWDPGRFDALHASPPCQAHTRAQHLRDAQGGVSRHGDLLTPTFGLIAARWSGLPWVVENVPGAPMPGAITLCGSSFGLGVRRHRLFASNHLLLGLPCDHRGQGRPWGVYHVPGDDIPEGGRTARDLAHGLTVMGMWRDVPWESLKEGIPPAYTRYLGAQLLDHLGAHGSLDRV